MSGQAESRRKLQESHNRLSQDGCKQLLRFIPETNVLTYSAIQNMPYVRIGNYQGRPAYAFENGLIFDLVKPTSSGRSTLTKLDVNVTSFELVDEFSSLAWKGNGMWTTTNNIHGELLAIVRYVILRWATRTPSKTPLAPEYTDLVSALQTLERTTPKLISEFDVSQASPRVGTGFGDFGNLRQLDEFDGLDIHAPKPTSPRRRVSSYPSKDVFDLESRKTSILLQPTLDATLCDGGSIWTQEYQDSAFTMSEQDRESSRRPISRTTKPLRSVSVDVPMSKQPKFHSPEGALTEGVTRGNDEDFRMGEANSAVTPKSNVRDVTPNLYTPPVDRSESVVATPADPNTKEYITTENASLEVISETTPSPSKMLSETEEESIVVNSTNQPTMVESKGLKELRDQISADRLTLLSSLSELTFNAFDGLPKYVPLALFIGKSHGATESHRGLQVWAFFKLLSASNQTPGVEFGTYDKQQLGAPVIHQLAIKTSLEAFAKVVKLDPAFDGVTNWDYMKAVVWYYFLLANENGSLGLGDGMVPISPSIIIHLNAVCKRLQKENQELAFTVPKMNQPERSRVRGIAQIKQPTRTAQYVASLNSGFRGEQEVVEDTMPAKRTKRLQSNNNLYTPEKDEQSPFSQVNTFPIKQIRGSYTPPQPQMPIHRNRNAKRQSAQSLQDDQSKQTISESDDEMDDPFETMPLREISAEQRGAFYKNIGSSSSAISSKPSLAARPLDPIKQEIKEKEAQMEKLDVTLGKVHRTLDKWITKQREVEDQLERTHERDTREAFHELLKLAREYGDEVLKRLEYSFYWEAERQKAQDRYFELVNRDLARRS